MKKIIIIAVSLLFLLSLFGCNFSRLPALNGDASAEQSETASSTESTSAIDGRISLEEAHAIAYGHWGIKPGDYAPEVDGNFFYIDDITDDGSYLISLCWTVDEYHSSTVDRIEIDAYTGEIKIK